MSRRSPVRLRVVGELIRSARLLTLAGPGGSGKTRLAIAAVSSSPDPAYFVELGAITEDALVAEAAATALGIRVPSRRTAAALV